MNRLKLIITIFLQNKFKHTYLNMDNKQNILSFRNLATLLNDSSHTNKYQQGNYKQKNTFKSNQVSQQHVDSSFGQIRQQNSRISSNTFTCVEHDYKKPEYIEESSKQYFCKKCAVQMITQGYRMISLPSQTKKSEKRISTSPLSQKSRKNWQQEINIDNSFGNQQQQSNLSYYDNPSLISQNYEYSRQEFIESKKIDYLNQKYLQSQQFVNEQSLKCQQKMEQLQQIIDGLKIKNIQYFNNIKLKNRKIYEEAINKQETKKTGNQFDLFGKSLGKYSYQSDTPLFTKPQTFLTENVQLIIDSVESLQLQEKKSFTSKNGFGQKIALIKSINSNESNRDKKLKSSSSISNLSANSNFRKQKSQCVSRNFPLSKCQQIDRQSSGACNSRISLKSDFRNDREPKQAKLKAKNSIYRRKKKSSECSDSCEDTPQSLKSKISNNGSFIPKDMAVAMFDKINVCQSIDIKADWKTNQFQQQPVYTNTQQNNYIPHSHIQRIGVQRSISSLTDQSNNKSISDTGKSRKSFNRYQCIDDE